MRRSVVALVGITVLLLLALFGGVASPVYANEPEVMVSPLMPGEGDEIAAGTGTITIINKKKITIISELDHMDSSEVRILPNHKAVYKKVKQGRHNLEVCDLQHCWEQEKNITLKKAYTWTVK